MDATTNPSRSTRATLLLAVIAAYLAGGCASRFSARTDYLAPGFNRESFRGKTVAVVPAGVTVQPAGEICGPIWQLMNATWLLGYTVASMRASVLLVMPGSAVSFESTKM